MVLKKQILVTGGIGYIGSNTLVQLIKKNFYPIVIDNLSNSYLSILDVIYKLTNVRPVFFEGDVRDRKLLKKIFNNFNIYAVIHFAGLKSVNESSLIPFSYYDNNVNGSISLINEMLNAKVKKIIFSSSATVYGKQKSQVYKETLTPNPINTYGNTKLIVENILNDLKSSDSDWKIAKLRYFNPAGANSLGFLGEKNKKSSENLIPKLLDVLFEKQKVLHIFGNDYNTPDGTGKRDYIHVEDIARGHILTLQSLEDNIDNLTLNLGIGKSFSVMEIIKTFEKITGKTIPYQYESRRKGDLDEFYADPSLAKNLIGWIAKKSLNEICKDSLAFKLNEDNITEN